MKIAIQGHPTRGREVIKILESLGGINSYNHLGNNPACYYEIHGNTIVCACTKSNSYKYYILDEFEKEFPLKVGDIILLKGLNKPCEIIALEWFMNKLRYKLDNGFYYNPKTLTTYKEMKEERNITLTLDKAKEWYKKGGELKEIALQAFSEKEIIALPRSWEEFCENGNPILSFRYNIPTKYESLYKLEWLVKCWRQGNIPQGSKYKIKKISNKYTVVYGNEDAFLSFCDLQTAEEFLECFRDLIEKAGDLI